VRSGDSETDPRLPHPDSTATEQFGKKDDARFANNDGHTWYFEPQQNNAASTTHLKCGIRLPLVQRLDLYEVLQMLGLVYKPAAHRVISRGYLA
jgi:hypothetical protein